MSKQASERSVYDLRSVKLPTLSGIPLRLLTGLMEGPFHFLVQKSLLDAAGVGPFRKLNLDDPPTFLPQYEFKDSPGTKEKPGFEPSLTNDTGSGFRFNTLNDYSRAYSEGKTSPSEVAQRLIESIIDSDCGEKKLRAFVTYDRDDILEQAEASEKRLKQGKSRSLIDGVPVSIKDQFDVKGYPTTAGTSFLGKSPAAEDSTVAARLRASGAIITGKTSMQEMGMGVTGLNPHHGVTRNPYNPSHYTGGSSSGPAAAVAAGLSPASVGADGGGSIRVPASLCGLVGLKPTYGRVSMFGEAHLCWSVEHLGPLATTAADAALIYSIISGPDPRDPATLKQPPVDIDGIDNTDLHGLTLGIYPEWFDHAAPEVVAACEALIEKLKNMGAEIREIVISGLEAGRVAHTITIASEIANGMEQYYREHHHEYGMELRLNLAMARRFTSRDYLKSQQVRTRMIAEFNRVLEEVDIIVTPTSGITAPAIPEKTLPTGESNLSELFEIMRFITCSNLTGLPAISFPVGYTGDNLPIGMQVIGKAWDENTLLRLAAAAESVLERKAPEVYFDLLKPKMNLFTEPDEAA